MRYLPLSERQQILRDYAESYGLRYFIETGTNAGDTPWELQASFDALWTIELDKTLYTKAVARFASLPKVHCVYGDSGEKLADVLSEVPGPALLWLDGHHSGPGTAHGDLDTPVVQELEAVFADGRKHVVLVDDARIFDGQPEHDDEPHYADYPSCEYVGVLAEVHNYKFLLRDDIMRLTPR